MLSQNEIRDRKVISPGIESRCPMSFFFKRALGYANGNGLMME